MLTAVPANKMEVELRGLIEKGMSKEQAIRLLKIRTHPDHGGNKDDFILLKSIIEPQREVVVKSHLPTAVMKDVSIGCFHHGGKWQICIAWVGYTFFRPTVVLVNKGTAFVPEWETVKIIRPTLIRMERGNGKEVVLSVGDHTITNDGWYDEDSKDIKIQIKLQCFCGSFHLQYLDPTRNPTEEDRHLYNHVGIGDVVQIPLLMSTLYDQMALGSDGFNINDAIPKIATLKDRHQNAKDKILVIDGTYGGATPNGLLQKITVISDNNLLPTGSDIFISNTKFNNAVMHWRIVTREFRDIANKPVFAHGGDRIQTKFVMPKMKKTKNPAPSATKKRKHEHQNVTTRRTKACLKKSYLFNSTSIPMTSEGYMDPTKDAHLFNSKLRPMIQSKRLELTVKQAEAVLCFAKSVNAWNTTQDASNELMPGKEYDIIVYRETRDRDPDFKIASPTIVTTNKFPKRSVPNTEFYRRIRAVYRGRV